MQVYIDAMPGSLIAQIRIEADRRDRYSTLQAESAAKVVDLLREAKGKYPTAALAEASGLSKGHIHNMTRPGLLSKTK
jgi:hypothetical protein